MSYCTTDQTEESTLVGLFKFIADVVGLQMRIYGWPRVTGCCWPNISRSLNIIGNIPCWCLEYLSSLVENLFVEESCWLGDTLRRNGSGSLWDLHILSVPPPPPNKWTWGQFHEWSPHEAQWAAVQYRSAEQCNSVDRSISNAVHCCTVHCHILQYERCSTVLYFRMT